MKLINGESIENKLKAVVGGSLFRNVLFSRKSIFENNFNDKLNDKLISEINNLNNKVKQVEIEILDDYRINSEKMQELRRLAGDYFDGKIKGAKEKNAVVKMIKVIESFYRKNSEFQSFNEKVKLIDNLKEIYHSCNNLFIFLTICELQSRFGMSDNFIKEEIEKYKDEPSVWNLYATIEKYNFKYKKDALDSENFDDALSSAIDKNEKALELDKDNYKILNSLGDCRKMDDRDKENNLEIAYTFYQKSLNIIESTQRGEKLKRNKLITLSGIAEVFRRKMELYKRYDNEITEQCIKKINECYDEIESIDNISRYQDNRYFLDRNKAYFDIAMHYKMNRKNAMARAYFVAIIESYDQFIELFKAGNYEIICKSFINNAIILMYEGNIEEAHKYFEMAKSLVKTNKKLKESTKELLEKNYKKFDVPVIREEGIIDSISNDGKSVIIHCKDCNRLHYAHISAFSEHYSLSDLEEMKNKKIKLEFNVFRIFKYPLHDENIRNAYDITVTEDSINEEYEKVEYNYPKAYVTLENSENYELVKSGYVGRFEFFDSKTGNGSISNKRDERYIKVKMSLIDGQYGEMKNLKNEFSLYADSKSFVKLDLYKEKDSIDEESARYIAKNIKNFL